MGNHGSDVKYNERVILISTLKSQSKSNDDIKNGKKN